MSIPSRLRRMAAGCVIAALGFSAAASAQTAGKGVTKAPAAQGVAEGVPAEMSKPDVQAVRGALRVSGFSLVDLDVPLFGTPAEAVLRVRLGGVDHDLVVTRYSMRSRDFRVITTGADGQLVEVAVPDPITFRGTSAQDQGAGVRVSILDGRVEGTVTLSNGVKWGIHPLADIVPGANPRTHVLYHAADIYPSNKRCPVEAVGMGAHEHDDEEGAVRGTGWKIADLAIEVDFPYYNLMGQNLVNTVNDVETTMNNVENIYENDTDITYEITTIHIWTTSSDPYSGSVAANILNQFRDYWNSNFTGVRRDVAHMFTGTNLDDPVLGIALLTTVCQISSAYGLVQSRWSLNAITRSCLSAHELGHNWSAQHCDGNPQCNIMCSGLGGCTGVCTSFGVSATQIINFRNTRGCLLDLADAQPLTFTDNFSSLITAAKWSYNFGASAVDSPIPGPPSPTRVLRLNSAGSGEFHDDDLRSNFLLADNTPVIEVRFQYAKKNVEAGETLILEYWAGNLRWNNVATIVSDGVTDTGYTAASFVLPSDASHDELRIRFRVDGDQTDDEWFIDDVAVGEPVEDPVPLPLVDQFPSTTFDSTVWSVFQAEINSAALAEPSAPNSAELDGNAPPGEQIWTKPVLAAGLDEVTVSYWVQRRGVEVGEMLVLEARDNTGAWVEVNAIVSPGGADQTTFTQFTHVLNTPQYLYDGLRFRWRSVCNNTTDNWYVDDVSITGGGGEPECVADWDGNGVVNSTDVGEFINSYFADQANGTLFADWDGNGVTNSTDVGEFINAFFAAPPECLG